MTKPFREIRFCVSWKQTGDKYRLQVNRIPSLRAEHTSFAEAEELLVDQIHDRFGQLGIQLIFDSPRPLQTTEHWRESGWVLLVPNVFWGCLGTVDSLFSQNRCRLCRLGVGSRTVDALPLVKPRRSVHLGYVAGGYPIPVVSEEFLSLFSAAELSGLKRRRCHSGGSGMSRGFIELLPKKLVACVDVSAVPDMVSWKCDVCGRVQVDQYLPGPFRFTAKQDSLPKDLQLALVGFPFDYDLAMPQSLWERIRKSKEVKDVCPEPLGMASKQHCVLGHRLMLSQHWKVAQRNCS